MPVKPQSNTTVPHVSKTVHGGLTPFMGHELQLASDNPKIERICHYGRRTRKTNCTAAQRITMQTAPATKPWPKPLYQDTRPATICAPRGGQRYKPRPKPRRHHLTHAADTGPTSPQRRHQHKAPCIVPLPGAAAATYSHKPKPPCHVSIYDTKQGGFIFYCNKTLKLDRMDTTSRRRFVTITDRTQHLQIRWNRLPAL